MLRKLCVLLIFCTSSLSALCQPTYNQIAKDTIISKSDIFGTIYFLNGKKLNLPVMEWFMTDHPKAYDDIRIAVVSDQLSISAYVVGSIFFVSGLIIDQQGQAVGNDLMWVGGLAGGTGLLFQLISNGYRRNAVRAYNQSIKSYYIDGDASSSWHLEPLGAGARLVIRF